jgi:hypothetical protein
MKVFGAAVIIAIGMVGLYFKVDHSIWVVVVGGIIALDT